jgi:hypothetical protein
VGVPLSILKFCCADIQRFQRSPINAPVLRSRKPVRFTCILRGSGSSSFSSSAMTMLMMISSSIPMYVVTFLVIHGRSTSRCTYIHIHTHTCACTGPFSCQCKHRENQQGPSPVSPLAVTPSRALSRYPSLALFSANPHLCPMCTRVSLRHSCSPLAGVRR